jgi:tetratricopeptide (TPR) repeat protein
MWRLGTGIVSFLLVASAALAQTNPPSPPARAIEKEALDADSLTIDRLLVTLGVSPEDAKNFRQAADRADDAQDVGMLAPWLRNGDETIAMMAAAMMMEMNPKKAEQRLRRELQAKSPPSPKILLTLALSERQETIDYLIERLDSKTAAVRENAVFALQIRTGQRLRETSEWTAWWKKQRATFQKPPPLDILEFASRWETINAGNVLGKLKEKDPDVPAPLKSIFSLFESGARLEFSKETLAAIRLFQSGKLDAAKIAYRKAVDLDQFDRIAQADYSFVLLEMDRFEEAAEAFERLVVLVPKSPLIEEFSRLTTDKIPAADRLGWLLTAIESRTNERHYNVSNDPLIRLFLSRSM